MNLRDATLMILTESAGYPELAEIDRGKPVPPRRRTATGPSEADPITAVTWPSR
jgi:hypothetical protein